MVDYYAYCQNQGGTDYYGDSIPVGGWHYSCQEQTGDNSVSQWAAIGIIPARRNVAAPIDPLVLKADQLWLDASFNRQGATNGYFGYTDNSPIWGPFADTPSGLVQLAMSGLGRGTTSPGGNNLWDSAETYIRDNFGNPASYGSGSSLKDYYYGMFSFTKSMLLHDNSGTGTSGSPLTALHSSDDPMSCAAPGVPVTSPGSGSGPCYPDINWYDAQSSTYGGSDPTEGVARTIVNDQQSDGSWFGQNFSGNQNYFQTAISIIMLNRTVFQAVPVACFTPTPNRVASGGPVTLDGRCSVDQNPANKLVSWQWDVSGTGGTNFTIAPGNAACRTASCSQISYRFSAPVGATLPYNYNVRLRVTDSANLTADVTGAVVISAPPNGPTARPGGPYNFCPNTKANGSLIYAPFLLDGSASTNPDQGLTDGSLNAPPDTITAYDWDFSCGGNYTDAHGSQPNVTTALDTTAFIGQPTFNVCLRVTTNADQAFPTAALPGPMTSVASAQVTVHAATDEVCSHCVTTLGANAKGPTPGVPGNIQLYWTDTNTSALVPLDHYNVYRSQTAAFTTFTQVAGANSSPYVAAPKVSAIPGGTVNFVDNHVVGGNRYFYRIMPALVDDTETCQSVISLPAAGVSVPVGRP
jgi:hypothetical protein